MSDANVLAGADPCERAKTLTSYILHKHYCENDIEALIELFDDRFHWFGAAEHEYAVGADTVKAIFRQFVGKVPRCNLSDETYDASEIVPGVYQCTGMAWIATDPATGVYLRVHQRITTIYRLVGDRLMCCHIHISNPYTEMAPDDVGFPTQMGRHTYDYLQEQVEIQKRKIAEQAAELGSIYDTVPCAIMRLLRAGNTYELVMINRAVADMLGIPEEELSKLDWSHGFCSEVVQEDAPAMRAMLQQLRRPGDHVDVVCRVRRPSGETIFINSSNAFIGEDERGQIIQKIAYDITDRIMMEEELERRGYEDALTGLYNRARFNRDVLDADTSSASRLGVAYFDVNGLKATNDKRGHKAGDELIRRVADHLGSRFPGMTYRIGGDEFVVVDADCDEDAFANGVAQACEALARDGISIAVGISWRAAGGDARDQFEEADRLMYEDKANHYREARNDRRARR